MTVSTRRRSPDPRPALPELHPGEAVVASLPGGRSYRLAEAADGNLSLVAGVPTRDAAAPLRVVRGLTTRRLHK